MGKIALRILFILSISFNLAFLGHLFLATPESAGHEKLTNHLRLSHEQAKNIRSASGTIDRENIDLNARVLKCREELVKALQEAEVDKEAVFKCIRDINALQQKIQENTIKKILIYKEHLSHEQCTCLMDHMCKKMHIAPDCCRNHCKIKEHKKKNKK